MLELQNILELHRHSITETPPINTELLVLIDTNPISNRMLWTIATWNGKNWNYPLNKIGPIIEWYELPRREKISNDYSARQQALEDFWNDR